MISSLVLASHNPGKVRELTLLLAPIGIDILSVGAFNLSPPEETAATFEGNALLKARYVSKQTGHWALADDSGFCLKALDGAPGLYSARWGGPERDFVQARLKIHEAIQKTGSMNRDASFVSVLALVSPDGQEYTFRGEVCGTFTWPARGENGYDYDSVFTPEGSSKTFAEMLPEEKNAMSHRGEALRQLTAFLKEPNPLYK